MIESLSLKCIFSIKKPVIKMAGKFWWNLLKTRKTCNNYDGKNLAGKSMMWKTRPAKVMHGIYIGKTRGDQITRKTQGDILGKFVTRSYKS